MRVQLMSQAHGARELATCERAYGAEHRLTTTRTGATPQAIMPAALNRACVSVLNVCSEHRTCIFFSDCQGTAHVTTHQQTDNSAVQRPGNELWVLSKLGSTPHSGTTHAAGVSAIVQRNQPPWAHPRLHLVPQHAETTRCPRRGLVGCIQQRPCPHGSELRYTAGYPV